MQTLETESTATRFAVQNQEAEQQYRATVIAIANGEHIPMNVLTTIRTAAGKSPEDFARHLAVLESRREAVDVLTRDADLRPAELQAELTTVTDLIAKEQQRHRESMEPLVIRRKLAAAELHDFQRDLHCCSVTAKNLLIRTAAPEARKRFDELSNQAVGLANRLLEISRIAPRLERERRDAARDLEFLEMQIQRKELLPDERRALEEKVTFRRELVAELDRQLAEPAILREEAAAAQAAVDKFTAESQLDWQSMNFEA